MEALKDKVSKTMTSIEDIKYMLPEMNKTTKDIQKHMAQQQGDDQQHQQQEGSNQQNPQQLPTGQTPPFGGSRVLYRLQPKITQFRFDGRIEPRVGFQAQGMIIVFATMSFMSLVMRNKSIYFNCIREVRFIRRCKQGALQFVILKPILVSITFLLYAKGKYKDGNFGAKQGYLYVTIIYTISYSLALYALVLFYVACRDLLQPFKPVPKFVIIKSVVFLTYWQGVIVFLAAKSGIIRGAEEAADVQNFVLCLEMAIAAVGHLYAFPYTQKQIAVHPVAYQGA